MKHKLKEKKLKYCDKCGKKSELSKWDYKKTKNKCPIANCVNDTWHHHYLCIKCHKP